MLSSREIRFLLDCIKLREGVQSILTEYTIQRVIQNQQGHSDRHSQLQSKLSIMLEAAEVVRK